MSDWNRVDCRDRAGQVVHLIVAPCGCQWKTTLTLSRISANCKGKPFAESGHTGFLAVEQFLDREAGVVR